MSENEYDDFEFGDYDLEEDVKVVDPADAAEYPGDAEQDPEAGQPVAGQPLGFTSVTGSTPAEAIAEARAGVLNNTFWGVGRCLITVRGYYDVNALYPTAAEGWNNAEFKHPRNDGRDCPRGAPVWWTGGSHGFGHVAISVGGGVCISTDWKESGRSNYGNINDITSAWGLDFKGYTNDLNKVFVWKPADPKPVVALANVRPGKKNHDVYEVKHALAKKGYGGLMNLKSDVFGSGTKRAYAKYQQRLGFSGKLADGIPGKYSLEKLGFRVK